MLVITRKAGQGLRIGNSIHVKVLEVTSTTVRLGLDAPAEVSVYRDEIYERVAEANRRALEVAIDPAVVPPVAPQADKTSPDALSDPSAEPSEEA